MRPYVLCALFVAVVSFGFAVPGRPCRLYRPPATRVDQGCINQGNDRRIAAPLVCGLQQKLSWKSENKPRLVRIGAKSKAHLEVAWPPYLVVNAPASNGYWHMFRLGFRYDRSWRGYIFPTAACKCIAEPLQY
jgi:hypothetical protein